jgi:hypothetical protein
MAKLIKKAETKATQFNVGDRVYFYSYWNDGRTSGSDEHSGTVTKVNKVTIDVQVGNGDVWRVERHELNKI